MGGREQCTRSRSTPRHRRVELMDDNDLDQLPVLEGDRVVGLITRADVARQLQLREDLDI